MRQKLMEIRINVGCGQTPTIGWKNFDNSFSVLLSRIPFLPAVLLKLRLIDILQYKYVKFAEKNQIFYGDVTKRLPFRNNTVNVVYSSHMLEHLDPLEADVFLQEALRVLCKGGLIRLALPDLQKQILNYNETGAADRFIAGLNICRPRPRSLSQRLRMLFVGTRQHQWMYDGKSASALLRKNGFVNPIILAPGKTKVKDPGRLDLFERITESFYIEAEKA